MNLNQTVTRIRQEFQTLGDTINTLGGIVLGGGGTSGRMTRTPAATGRTPGTGTGTTHKRTLTPAGRKAIAQAQTKRWALLKSGAGNKKAA